MLEYVLGAFSVVAIVVLIYYILDKKYKKGQKDKEKEIMSFISKMQRASLDQSKKRIKLIKESNTIMDRYDIIFDMSLVSYLATAGVVVNWDESIVEMMNAVKEKSIEFPNGTNTVIVRSIKILPDGMNEYVFEPLSNPNTKSIFSSDE